MSDVRWIKITTDIFDDEKIQLIESMSEGDTLIVIWFKLLVLAGKQNYKSLLYRGNADDGFQEKSNNGQVSLKDL